MGSRLTWILTELVLLCEQQKKHILFPPNRSPSMFEEFSVLRKEAETFFRTLQDEITATLEVVDGTQKFREDLWQRPGGGGGRTRVMESGAIFEKAGVNFSAVHGDMPTKTELKFFATGVSLVLHPHSPKIPTIHANFRFLQNSNGDAWFGGGIDLTPYYLDEDDTREFHTKLKHACDRHDLTYYPRFKSWCDEYFFIRHRGETRGVGGVFFDQLSGNERELGKIFAFVQDIGHTFLPSYVPIVEKHRNDPYTEAEQRWQLLRHGRYVEFNLVYDKGTVFGLETQGRIESILMSLPTLARWEYDMQPKAGSPEAKLLDVLRNPRDWAALG
jgi:coproporphyrinogen III oxidase